MPMVLALALVFSLSACHNRSEITPTKDDIFTDKSPEEIHTKSVVGSDFAKDVKVAELSGSDTKVVVMMTVDWDYIDTLQKSGPFHQYEATKAWQATYPGGDVKIHTVQLNEHTMTLSAQVAGGESDDIIPGNSGTYPLWPSKGLTMDMNRLKSYLDLENPEIYDQELMKAYTYKGQQAWAVMTSAPTRTYLAYNKTKFDNCGEKTPMEYYLEGKWDWTQFVKTAKAMTSGDKTDFGFTGWGLGLTSCYPMTIINDDGTVKLNIDDTKFVRYATAMYDVYQKENCARNDWDLQNWAILLPQGTDCMTYASLSFVHPNGFENMVKSADRKQTDADIRLAPIPRFDPNDEPMPIIPVETWGYCISSRAANPIGAAEYIRLEAIVMNNIEAMHIANGDNYLMNYLNDDEKALVDYINTCPTITDYTKAIGNCWNILDQDAIGRIHYDEAELDMRSLLANIKPLLQAEVALYNDNLLKDNANK